MPFLFICEHCGQEIVIAERRTGATVICSDCGAHLRVPEIAAETDREPDHRLEDEAEVVEPPQLPEGHPAGPPGRVHAELQARTLGGFLDDGFLIYRRQFWKMVAIVAVPSVIMFGLGWIWVYSVKTMVVSSFRLSLPGSLPDILVALGLVMAGFVVYGFAQGALVHAVGQWHVWGSVSLRKTLGFVLPRLWPIVAARLLAGLQLVVVGAVGIGLFYVVGPLGRTYPLAALIAVIFAGILVYLWVRWTFIEHAVLIEGSSAQAGLAQSELHVKGYWWRVFFIVFVMGLITLLAVVSVGDMPTRALTGVADHIVRTLSFPLYAIVVTLLYFDLRVTKEGYKSDDLMHALEDEM